MNRKLTRWTLLLAVVAASPFAVAQQAPTPAPAADVANLPTGEQVIEKFIEATGGRAAYEKLNNRISNGSFEMPAAGIKASMSIIQAAPNKARVTMDIPGVGKVEQGCDGDTVWEKSDIQGVRILDGAERETMLRQLAFNSELNWKNLYKSAETVGAEDVDGKPAIKVKLVAARDESVMHNFYDKESGLLVRTDMVAKTQVGDLPVTIRMSDYRDVDGIKIPMLATQNLGNMEQTITTESVKHNTEIPADAFTLPPEVKALKDKAPATQPGN
jgi:hypothetical protein